MTNSKSIAGLSEILGLTGNTIAHLACSIEAVEADGNEDFSASLKDMMLNELENLQHTVLCLTGLVAEIAGSHLNHDEGSVFATGDLNDDLGDKTDESADVFIDTEAEEEEK